MNKKLVAAGTLLFYFTAQTCPVFAAQAFILSDEELDEVHASGLNFDINNFLGSRSDTASNFSRINLASLSSQSPNSSVIHTSNSNIQIIQPPQPSAPKASSPVVPGQSQKNAPPSEQSLIENASKTAQTTAVQSQNNVPIKTNEGQQATLDLTDIQSTAEKMTATSSLESEPVPVVEHLADSFSPEVKPAEIQSALPQEPGAGFEILDIKNSAFNNGMSTENVPQIVQTTPPPSSMEPDKAAEMAALKDSETIQALAALLQTDPGQAAEIFNQPSEQPTTVEPQLSLADAGPSSAELPPTSAAELPPMSETPQQPVTEIGAASESVPVTATEQAPVQLVQTDTANTQTAPVEQTLSTPVNNEPPAATTTESSPIILAQNDTSSLQTTSTEQTSPASVTSDTAVGQNTNLTNEASSVTTGQLTGDLLASNTATNSTPDTITNSAPDTSNLSNTASEQLASNTTNNSPVPESNSTTDSTPSSTTDIAVGGNPVSGGNGIQIDILADNAGNFQMAVNDNAQSQTSTPDVPVPDTDALIENATSHTSNSHLTTAPGSGGINIVDVGDQSQQNLSALVNVNAAGSVVPVMVNLTIIINSNVQSLSNLNDLNISNFNTFQFR